MSTDLHMINLLHNQLVEHTSKFRMRVKLQFQQQSKMAEGNFFYLYFGNSDFDSEFERFDLILL